MTAKARESKAVSTEDVKKDVIFLKSSFFFILKKLPFVYSNVNLTKKLI